MGTGSPLLRGSTRAYALAWRCACLVVFALAVAFASASPVRGSAPALSVRRTSAATLSQLETSLLFDINTFRARHRFARLSLSPALTAAARAHSRQMAQDGYFSHASPDGSAFWKRLQRFYPTWSYSYWSVGENLLWQAAAIDGSSALRLWLASPEHRANLMNPSWREIGISALQVAHAPGVYRGLDVTIVTTDFGVRR
jgi:uncharacterized protein YkwD